VGRTVRETQSREKYLRHNRERWTASHVIWLDEPRPLASDLSTPGAGITVVGVASDAPAELLTEWLGNRAA
jgi:hypothetical protein